MAVTECLLVASTAFLALHDREPCHVQLDIYLKSHPVGLPDTLVSFIKQEKCIVDVEYDMYGD